MLGSSLIRKGAIVTPASVGDVLNQLWGPIKKYVVANGNVTVTAEDLAKGDIAAVSDTAAHLINLPKANDILIAMRGNLNKLTPQGSELYHLNQPAVEPLLADYLESSPEPLFTFLRRFYARNAGGTMTLTEPTEGGIFMKDLEGAAGGFVALATNTVTEVIFRIINSTPTLLAVGDMQSPGALGVLTLENKEQAKKVTPGMAAYGSALTGNAGFVKEVDYNNGKITFDVDADETGLKSITLTPVIHVTAIATGTIAAASFA